MSSVYIYRAPGERGVKVLSLHRERDLLTELSFLDYAYGSAPIKFNVTVLQEAGYVVRYDGLQRVTQLSFFGSTLYIEPNSGESLIFPEGHCTIYHPDESYWKAWHAADFANLHSEAISSQLQAFYDLRERD